MKAVLLSIQPKWCELIASGKKTVEVRKTKPKLETPFKVYIYATKPRHYFKISEHLAATDENLFLSNGTVKMSDGFEHWADGIKVEYLNGKVIGEFVCDEIFPIRVFENGSIQDYNRHSMERSCVPYDDISNYIGSGCMGYGWHISDLKIYDNPKNKVEFCHPCDRDPQCDCRYCVRYGGNKPILRAPQSWCYVEQLQNEYSGGRHE